MNLRVRYLQQDKQFSFEPETSVSQCLQTLRQRLNIALSDAAFAQYGLFVSMEVDEKNALAVGPVANAIGSYLPEEVLLRVGLNGKVDGLRLFRFLCGWSVLLLKWSRTSS